MNSPWNRPPSFRNAPTIANPTVTGVPIGVWKDVAASGIPVIGISSGSVDATGNITGITALPLAYPHAYCYFPANILATSIAAGYYYCTFSTTTAGVAYLDSWTPGTIPPTVPASPTAVTDGKGAYTGDTSARWILIQVPANTLGPNGMVEAFARSANNNSAGTKNVRIRWPDTSGQDPITTTHTTGTYGQYTAHIVNMGATGKQLSGGFGNIGFSSALGITAVLSTADTTAAQLVCIANYRNTATDNAIIESYFVRTRYGA